MSDGPARRLAALFAERFAQGASPALAVRAAGEASGGREALQVDGMFGTIDESAPDTAPTPDTAFRIASCTKSFTAAGILCLRGAGLLDLDEDVRAFLPQLRLTGPVPVSGTGSGPMTLRMLLAMTSGFPADNPWADRLEALAREDFDDMLAAGLRPVRPPGKMFGYSNLGYALLGRVIETVAGQDYRQFITSALLHPLGLHHTGFDSALPVPVAVGYRRAPAGWEPQPLSPPGAFSAIGGLFSTISDLERWIRWLGEGFGPGLGNLPDSPLPRRVRREMQQIHTVCPPLPGDPPGLVRGYGFGVRVEDLPRTGRIISHSGGYPGYSAHMCWHPPSGSVALGFENATYSRVGAPVRQALDLLIGAGRTGTARHSPQLIQRAEPPAALPWPELEAARAAVEAFVRNRDTASERTLRALFAGNVELDVPFEERRDRLAGILEALGPPVPPGTADLPGTTADASGCVLQWKIPTQHGQLGCEIHLSPAEPPRISVLRFTGGPEPVSVEA